MDIIKQILESFSGTLPKDSETAAAISRGAGPEEIAACATAEGLHALAGARRRIAGRATQSCNAPSD